MILSKKNKLVFIKGRKVASTSVEVFLSSVCGKNDIITPITPVDEKLRMEKYGRHAQNYGATNKDHTEYISKVGTYPMANLKDITHPAGAYYNHMPLSQVINLFGEIPSDWCIFAIERCPYRKIISLANMQLKVQHYKTTGTAMVSEISDIKQQVAMLIDSGRMQTVKNIQLYKHNGITQTKILKYENLSADLTALMSSLNIEKYSKLPHLKKGVSSLDIDLTDIFSKSQFAKINKIFDEEFDLFGYTKH